MSFAIPWSELAPFLLIGFAAQLVDSAFGMAFGLVSNALLTFLGFPPSAASATSRTVESFASGISGLSHALQRNIDWPLFGRLVIPGILGGLAGVWFLSVIDTQITRPAMLVYMAAIGVYLIWRAPRRPQTFRRMRFVGPLGAVGGFLDASAGGGWGPVVTGNLLAQGMTPRMAIGTVNAAEFFVAVTVLSAFIGTLGLAAFTIATTGLLVGAIVGAPLGAWLTGRIAPRQLLMGVGAILIAISLYGLISLMFEPLPSFMRL
ncbi:sulfite exporter TauE/SafE family protein [Sphingosinicella soli]|uniref:Probable membrane transporter protein n=1 Tax=Sphingosinicella soli TaxID=333708 RepID=A0A7W7B0M5_9SPHN|nr:sulfite exporter TauE/SafE family protein [Sphingosinicella soli]MBB4631858.1 hypothetical protein [Sphingosinicella soli]